jgi:hypothetical protein
MSPSGTGCVIISCIPYVSLNSTMVRNFESVLELLSFGSRARVELVLPNAVVGRVSHRSGYGGPARGFAGRERKPEGDLDSIKSPNHQNLAILKQPFPQFRVRNALDGTSFADR